MAECIGQGVAEPRLVCCFCGEPFGTGWPGLACPTCGGKYIMPSHRWVPQQLPLWRRDG